jgi:hypothetical protein
MTTPRTFKTLRRDLIEYVPGVAPYFTSGNYKTCLGMLFKIIYLSGVIITAKRVYINLKIKMEKKRSSW